MKWRWGTKKQDSLVRGENRGVGTTEEIVSLPFLALRTAQNSFVMFATGQLHSIDAIVKNNVNILRQISPKHLEQTLISCFSSFGNHKEALQASLKFSPLAILRGPASTVLS